MSIPAPRTPIGVANDADRLRACERLSAVHGREIRGGWSVDQLAAEYALLYAAGFEAGQRDDGSVGWVIVHHSRDGREANE